MKRRNRRRGTALLAAVVVTIVAVGVGAAFLTETASYHRFAMASDETDEAQVLCDAALEKARLAMWKYGHEKGWSWSDVLKYCNGLSTDLLDVKQSFESVRNTTWFRTYWETALSVGSHASSNIVAPVPAKMAVYSSADVNYGLTYDPFANPEANFNFMGFNQPFMSGAYHVVVRDNDDGDGDPLTDSDKYVYLIVTVTLPAGAQAQIEAFVYDATVSTSATAPAAIASHVSISTLGNIEIDGRNWSMDGTEVVGDGVYGILSTDGVSVGGSSGVGGNGNAPPSNGAATDSIQEYYSEPLPETADEVIDAVEGMLKQVAQRRGTYFSSQDDYNTYLTANAGNLPGGGVYYLEFDPGPPWEIGDTMNEEPSILVVHDAATSTVARNVHGQFRGLMLCDSIDKINSGTEIIGSIYCFSSLNPDTFGNGNALIKHSSETLGNLPSVGQDAAGIASYRKLK